MALFTPFLKKGKKIHSKPLTTSWNITDDCVGCEYCWETYEDDFIDGDDGSAHFREGHYFNSVSNDGHWGNCGPNDFNTVQAIALECPLEAIVEAG
jgi:ferredoxin